MKITIEFDNPTPEDLEVISTFLKVDPLSEQSFLNAESVLEPKNPPTVPSGLTFTSVPPPPPPTVDLDSDGRPWDERIHSSSKAKTKNGVWKLKRGVDEDLVKQVNVTFDGVPIDGNVIQRDATPEVIEQAQTHDRDKYVALIRRISEAIGTERLTQAQATECCIHHGVESIPKLANNLHLVDLVSAEIDLILSPKKVEDSIGPFVGFVAYVSKLLADQRVTQDQVMRVYETYGISSLPVLGQHPDLIPIVKQQIEALVK